MDIDICNNNRTLSLYNAQQTYEVRANFDVPNIDLIKFDSESNEEKQMLIEKNKRISTENEQIKSYLGDQCRQIDALNNQINKLKQDIQDRDEVICELKPYKDIFSTSERKIESYKRDNMRKSDEIQTLQNNLNNKNHEINVLKVEILSLDDEIKEKNKTLNDEIKDLKKKNKTLNDENGKWQNYIGKATTFSLSDDDENHTVQLVKDITTLQSMIENYVGTLRKVDVDFGEVNRLLRCRGCKVEVKPIQENDLPLVKAVLQCYVFDELIKNADSLFTKNDCLEAKIYNQTKSILDLLNKFLRSRDGTNEITNAFPIKLRQQIFGFLGNLGFADTNDRIHDVISSIKDRLNDSINKIRKYKSPQKKTLHNDMATKLVREFIRICYFRLKVQEPIPELRWFSFSNYEKKNQKLYSRAKVVHKFKRSHDSNKNLIATSINTLKNFVYDSIYSFKSTNVDEVDNQNGKNVSQNDDEFLKTNQNEEVKSGNVLDNNQIDKSGNGEGDRYSNKNGRGKDKDGGNNKNGINGDNNQNGKNGNNNNRNSKDGSENPNDKDGNNNRYGKGGDNNQNGEGGDNNQSGIVGNNNRNDKYGSNNPNNRDGGDNRYGRDNNQSGKGGDNNRNNKDGSDNPNDRDGGNNRYGKDGDNNQNGKGGDNNQSGIVGNNNRNDKYGSNNPNHRDGGDNRYGRDNNQSGKGGDNNRNVKDGDNNQNGKRGDNNQYGKGRDNDQSGIVENNNPNDRDGDDNPYGKDGDNNQNGKGKFNNQSGNSKDGGNNQNDKNKGRNRLGFKRRR
ncbi:14376_t:CDS:2 [Funneliformis caledonium]|uniref:14376_t:CDS:1 n=1 Tax=Funneliformis caledonium TaxID=1117310 RepID=A0A9N9G624_9GLOM|nr:14376_t:CDS:2 [Funneliformis caledonium]